MLQEIKETGKGLGLTACQQGSAIIASLITTHIPPVSGTRTTNQILFDFLQDFKLTNQLLSLMLVVSPKERISLVDILLDKQLQKVVENPHDGKVTLTGIIINYITLLGHWYE